MELEYLVAVISYSIAKNLNSNNIVCCARDGYYIQKAIQIINRNSKCTYVYANRMLRWNYELSSSTIFNRKYAFVNNTIIPKLMELYKIKNYYKEYKKIYTYCKQFKENYKKYINTLNIDNCLLVDLTSFNHSSSILLKHFINIKKEYYFISNSNGFIKVNDTNTRTIQKIRFLECLFTSHSDSCWNYTDRPLYFKDDVKMYLNEDMIADYIVKLNKENHIFTKFKIIRLILQAFTKYGTFFKSIDKNYIDTHV